MSIDAENAFNKMQQSFMIKTLQKVGIEWTYLNIIKIIYSKPTTNILSGEETYEFNASANDIQKDSYGQGQPSEFIWRCHFQTVVSHWPLKENQLYRAYWLRECQCNAV